MKTFPHNIPAFALALVALALHLSLTHDANAASWATNGPLATACQFHTATLLPNGEVLVAGGADSSYNSLASATVYNPLTGLWAITGPLTVARYQYTATLLPNGKVLVVGGNGISSILSSAELYDPPPGHGRRRAP